MKQKLLLALLSLFSIVATAQCPTGSAPFVSAGAVGNASAINSNSATIATPWAAFSGAFSITVYIEYGLVSGGPYTSAITYTQAAFNSATATVGTSGGGAGTGTYSPGNGSLTTSGTFTANITGLTPSTTYYYRSRIVGSTGTCSSPQKSFTTTAVFPGVATTALSSIGSTTVTSGGSITNAISCTQKGVVWGTSTGPTVPSTNSTTQGVAAAGASSYTSAVTGLAMNTKYYLRAYIIDGGVTYYGTELSFYTSFSGTTPLAISPEWRFGNNAGLKFSGGVATPQGAITGVSTTGNVEASTSVCDTNGKVVIFTDSRTVYSTISGDYTVPLLRDIENLDGIASGSSTQGCIGFPDPASPFDTYYLFTANDFSGGTKQYKGINYYKFKLIGGTMKRIVGPKNLIGDAGVTGVVDESLMAVPDGAGNYWLASHSQSTAEFYIWKIGTDTTRATIVGSLTKYLATGTVSPAGKSVQSSVRFNSCVNKIAWTRADQVRVHAFNQTTGAVTLAPSYSNPGGADFTSGRTTYQAEFSQNGNMLFVSAYQSGADQLTLIDLNGTAGNWSVLDTREMWGLQLGPNGNIYAAGASSGTTNYYEITNTNNSPVVTQKSLAASTSTYRGIETLPLIGNVVNTKAGAKLKKSPTNCRDFMFGFRYYNYFNEAITISSAIWTFKDKITNVITTVAVPSPYTDSINYVLPTTNAFDVYVTTIDAFCGGTRQSATFTVTPNCSLPVEFINISATSQPGLTKVFWSTAKEVNSSTFTIQRSTNGRDFKDIGTISAAGNSKQIRNYSFQDLQPLDGIVYYRVRENDNDGTQLYSAIVSTDSKTDGKIYTISNNPFKNEFSLNILGEKDIRIDIFDASGKLIYSNKIEDASGSIPLGSELNSGAYILEIIDNTTGKAYRDKLLKY